MPDPKHLKVVAVGPRDVKDERDVLDSVIRILNKGIAAAEGLFLELERWDTDVYPGPPHQFGWQGSIDSVLLKQVDIIIGIFWARFGTPVHDAGSGTEHELNAALKAYQQSEGAGIQPPRPWVMVYFNSQPISLPTSIEQTEQLAKVLKFRDEWKGVTGEYVGLHHFSDRVLNDLTMLIRDKFSRVAQADWTTRKLSDAPLYTFCGLQRGMRDDDVFQDFNIDRDTRTNINPISYLWADVFEKSTISAEVDRSGPHLKVWFDNKKNSYPSNIAIRPIGESALNNGDKRSKLVLEARVPPESVADGDGREKVRRDASGIYIGLRVINGWYQHWVYGEGTCYTRKKIAVAEDWTIVSADLTSNNWWLFESDGNHIKGLGPLTPDFRIIAGLVLEVGGPDNDRCGPGSGTVLVRNIRLVRLSS